MGVGGVVETDLVLWQGQLVGDSNHFEDLSMASPGRSIGLVLHSEGPPRMADQLAWLLISVSLGAVYLLGSNIWLGVKDSRKQS
jgi:hypothetical protein